MPLLTPTLRFTVPVPPSVNHMYRTFTKDGRAMRVKTKTADNWFRDALWQIKGAKNAARWKKLEEKVVVDLWVWWPDLRLRDCDNLNKCIMDAIKQAGVVADDHLCLPRWQDYDLDREAPRVEVGVWKLDGFRTIAEPKISATAQSSAGSQVSSVTVLPATPTTGP